MILLLALSQPVCAAVPAPLDVPMHQVLAALDGRAPAPHPRVLVPPPELDGLARDLPPPAGKDLYGGRMDNHLDSENFTVAWADDEGSRATAELALEGLEGAWEVLVDDRGWTPPVSSDRYLLWVILDPSLSGTGLTTEYVSGDFPEGYPVIYLDPEWAAYPGFFRHLAAHEFGHALQYAVRDWAGSDREAWFWEASAEWMVEIALPGLDEYAASATWYAVAPELRFDSQEGSHAYGMVVLSAFLEERVTGDGGLREAWELAGERPGEGWDDILADSTGWPAGDLWAGLSGAMAAADLRESDLYEPVALRGVSSDGQGGTLPRLGTHYWEAADQALVTGLGPVVLATPAEEGQEVVVRAGEVLAVTGLKDGADYTLSLSDPPAGDTGDPLPVACGCRSSSPAGPWLLVALLPLLTGRRAPRRSR